MPSDPSQAVHTPRASTGEPVFGRSLCAVDGKDGGFAAIEQAASLARGGRMTILVVTSFRVAGDHRGPAIGPLRAKDIVERAKAIAERAGVDPTIEVEPATPPAEVVLGWAAEHDLLAIGPPASSWLGGMLIAGVADSAIASFTTPLLAARPGVDGAPAEERVLLASDGHEDSREPLEVAAGLARERGSQLTLLHALGPLHGAREAVLEQARELQSLIGREAEVVFGHGGAHAAIVETARRLPATLVVLGSRRRAGVRALGSVSRRVAHNAPCSVLIVPPAVA